MVTDPLASDPWLPAERAAELYRHQRLRPSARHRFADRWLLPAAVLLLIVSSALLLSTLLLSGSTRETVRDTAMVLVVLTFALSLLWGVQTHRVAMTRTLNLRSTLPLALWPKVRQEIAGNHVPDPAHIATITEIAHQQRAQQQGQLVTFAVLIPMYLYLSTDHDPLAPAILTIGTIGVAFIAAAAIIQTRRLTRFINQHDHETVIP